MAKLNLSAAIAAVFSVPGIFSNMPFTAQETFLIINVENGFVFSGFFDEWKVQKNIYLKWKSIFRNILQVFVVTLDQFNASFLNKNITFLKKILTDSQLLNSSAYASKIIFTK